MTVLNLELPENLIERRRVLESELSKVVIELCFTGLRDELNKVFKEYNVDPKPTSVSWDFYGEYDDEGGTDYYPRGVIVYADENQIDLDEHVINKKSQYSDAFYDYKLDEELHEIIYGYREDLYEHDIENIDL